MPRNDPSEYPRRAEAFEASDDVPSNPVLAGNRPTIGDVINERFSRRCVLRGMLGTAAISGLASSVPGLLSHEAKAVGVGRFRFDEITHGVDETHHVAEGYSADILIRWGDPLHEDAPEFDPHNQSAAAQEQQFGYNNDFIGFVPVKPQEGEEARGLLCVIHEYTNEEVMFPRIGRHDRSFEKGGRAFFDMTAELVAVEQAAHGGTIVEVVKRNGRWSYDRGGLLNRRITAGSTQCLISGPAAGHDRLKTNRDPTGTRVIGTINNCAGGITPWGTYLLAEENFHGYFLGELPKGHREAVNYERYGVPGGFYAWVLFDERFNLGKEPNEPNRFGWMVEVDPMDPTSIPIKRTALGRMKHEGGETVVNKDGRIVIYMGDDQRFDYLYKFVTAGRYDTSDRKANMQLLDEGTLYVARFDADGTLQWLPLVYGEGPLTTANGFESQADVMIDTRRAADLLGATPMDRPEDVEPNPKTGRVYAMLTNNSKRKEDQVDAANPRAENLFGHIIEISEPDMDFAATKATWEILVRCGDPAKKELGALWNPATSENGWFASPDNCVVDGQGRLWVSTDQGSGWSLTGTADGVWALETEGELRGTGHMFYRVPVGAEMCGPCFADSDQVLFVAVQHVATDGTKRFEPFQRRSTFEDPATRWPDFKEDMPPRPSVVAITKKGGGVIGS